MERLNSLGSSLPPEQPPTTQAIESLNGELSQEFKLAANAVTKLYRVANERNSLLRHHGYLNCVEDILNMLIQDSTTSVDDIRIWCLKQKNDILSHKNNNSSNNNTEGNKNGASKFDFNFESPNSNNNTETTVPKFRLSSPPLSVEHFRNQTNSSKTKKPRWSLKKQQTWKEAQRECECSNKNTMLEQDDESTYNHNSDNIESKNKSNNLQRKANAFNSPPASATKKQKITSTTATATRRKK